VVSEEVMGRTSCFVCLLINLIFGRYTCLFENWMIQHKGFFGFEDSGFSSIDKRFLLPRDSHLLGYNTQRHRDGNAENKNFKNISSEGLVKVGGTETLIYLCQTTKDNLLKG
jgi:hypothetical protein